MPTIEDFSPEQIFVEAVRLAVEEPFTDGHTQSWKGDGSLQHYELPAISKTNAVVTAHFASAYLDDPENSDPDRHTPPTLRAWRDAILKQARAFVGVYQGKLEGLPENFVEFFREFGWPERMV